MKFGRRLKKGVCVSTDTDCQNCDSLKRVCVWDGECDNLEQMTEQEYIQTCNTEQLAEYILNVWLDGALNVNAEFGLNEAQIEKHKGYILEWLKQPHRPIS